MLVAFHPVLQCDDRGLMAHQGLESCDHMPVLIGLNGEQDEVNRSHLCGVVGCVHLDHKFSVGPDQFESIGADGFQVLATDNEPNVVTCFAQ